MGALLIVCAVVMAIRPPGPDNRDVSRGGGGGRPRPRCARPARPLVRGARPGGRARQAPGPGRAPPAVAPHGAGPDGPGRLPRPLAAARGRRRASRRRRGARRPARRVQRPPRTHPGHARRAGRWPPGAIGRGSRPRRSPITRPSPGSIPAATRPGRGWAARSTGAAGCARADRRRDRRGRGAARGRPPLASPPRRWRVWLGDPDPAHRDTAERGLAGVSDARAVPSVCKAFARGAPDARRWPSGS